MMDDGSEDFDLDAFIQDFESKASRNVYASRHRHVRYHETPGMTFVGPPPQDPQELPPIEDELPSGGDEWE